MNYRVCLEIGYDGKWVFARLPDLMGCFSKEKEREAALEKLPDRINAYITWLKNHGENIEKSERIEIDLVEIFECYEDDGYEVNAFFEADRTPLSKEEIEKGIQRMIWSRQDLLEKISSLSQEVLDKRLNDKWSIRRNLEHIATAEWWYLTRLNLKLPHHKDEKVFPQSASDGLEKMKALRELSIEKLSVLNEEERSQITVHSGERWTARKVLKRFLEHEQEHIHSIDLILSG
jgi:uncharacterized damage-inducible protein DinB/predicted RNase H-like HicB family nuclease